jgi:hypothetical protein
MRSSNSQPARSRSATQPDVATGNETARIIGNPRVKHNACLMAHNQYGMGEFGRLFYLISDLDKRRLEGVFDSTDEVRESHRLCLRCSLKFVAFCRFFCGIQLPRRLASSGREYDRLPVLFGPGREIFCTRSGMRSTRQSRWRLQSLLQTRGYAAGRLRFSRPISAHSGATSTVEPGIAKSRRRRLRASRPGTG